MNQVSAANQAASNKNEMVDFILDKVAQLTKKDRASLNGESSLAQAGVDSLFAVLICGELEERYETDIEPVLMFKHKTANEVADAVIELVGKQ